MVFGIKIRHRNLSGEHNELEDFLSKEAGEPVTCDEPNPVFYKTVSLLPLGKIGVAQLYRTAGGAMKAVLVPFGLTLLSEETRGKK